MSQEGDIQSTNAYWMPKSWMGFPGGSAVKNLPANAGDMDSVPGWGKSSGKGNDNPLQWVAWEIPWIEKPGGL